MRTEPKIFTPVFKNGAGHGRVGQCAGIARICLVHLHPHPVESIEPFRGTDPDKPAAVAIDAGIGALREALRGGEVVKKQIVGLAEDALKRGKKVYPYGDEGSLQQAGQQSTEAVRALDRHVLRWQPMEFIFWVASAK